MLSAAGIAARVPSARLAKVNTAVRRRWSRWPFRRRVHFVGRFVLYGHDHGGEREPVRCRSDSSVGGMTFSLGLIPCGGRRAELFTGNNLIAMAWAARCVQTRQVVRNYLGLSREFVGRRWNGWCWCPRRGAIMLGTERSARLMVISRAARSRLIRWRPLPGDFVQRMVCLAVWLCMGRGRWRDKVLAILFPISAFVACGFEHSVANMFSCRWGLALAGRSASCRSGRPEQPGAGHPGNIMGDGVGRWSIGSSTSGPVPEPTMIRGSSWLK